MLRVILRHREKARYYYTTRPLPLDRDGLPKSRSFQNLLQF
jgi:hypothetical protein